MSLIVALRIMLMAKAAWLEFLRESGRGDIVFD